MFRFSWWLMLIFFIWKKGLTVSEFFAKNSTLTENVHGTTITKYSQKIHMQSLLIVEMN